MSAFESWGRFPRASQSIQPFRWPWQGIIRPPGRTLLPYGLGRSYGDSCLNDGGELLSTRELNRFISFDQESGVIRCEAGVSLDALHQATVPRGWFVPVTPGTRFVTLGGAVANDVHGKNHHRAGTLGRHVRSFGLLRSDGQRLVCSPQENQEVFAATIGGLGLTGLIVWVEIQLIRIANPYIDMHSTKFSNLEEFFVLSKESDSDSEYTVAWLDCVASGADFGRGIFMKGNFCGPDAALPTKRRSLRLRMPFDAPALALNNLTVRAFNYLYFNKQRQKSVSQVVHYEPFFYPLDAVEQWNRIYGRRGFLQFQCVVPSSNGQAGIRAILETIVASGRASFLAVLKEFGALQSPGMLSFPRPGVTLCLDFPNQGQATMALFKRLDEQTRELGGAMYPAKDATMSGESFRSYFPRWQEFSKHIDPAFSSSFWRRVTV